MDTHVDWEEIINQIVNSLRALEKPYSERIGIANRAILRLQKEQARDHQDFHILWALRIRRIQMYRDALQECLNEQIYDVLL